MIVGYGRLHFGLLLICQVLLTSGCQAGGENPRQLVDPNLQFINSDRHKSMDLPFSEAVQVGNLLFLSGRIGNIPGSRELVPGGIRAETQQALDQIRAVLEQSGSALDQVVKCTVFLADMDEWQEMNLVYQEFFADNPPARSALGAAGLALGARVEIECIAAVPLPKAP